MRGILLKGMLAALGTLGLSSMAAAQEHGRHYTDRHVGTYYDRHHGDYTDTHYGTYVENHGWYQDVHRGFYRERHHGNFWMPHTYSYVEQHHVPRTLPYRSRVRVQPRRYGGYGGGCSSGT